MKKIIAFIISLIFINTSIMSNNIINVNAQELNDVKVTNIGGWNETLFMQISDINDSDVKAVSYSGPINGTLTGEDFEYLVRDHKDGVRIDIPGLKAGTYSITVSTASGDITKNDVFVNAQDRSGYAHFNYTEGVGAYNDDGTLKENAVIIYVTNENKNTVTISSSDGTTVSGIGNILNSGGQEYSKGLTSKGGKANTNQDILKKLAMDGVPLVVRIIGDVTAPEGVTAYSSVDYGGGITENGFMAKMQSGKDITIEGIGTDAKINGWGLSFIAQSSHPQFGKSFELKNISFYNVPEDCIGMEGKQDDATATLTVPVERCWVHNCAFYAPVIENPAEEDKGGGDGACDFKCGQYFTNSYCYYEGYHKTMLVGGGDTQLQYHLSYHHNYWKDCESRCPLSRQANIHMYNNIFEGQTSYAMNTRATAYIFSEYNIFTSCKNPMDVDSGAIKSYKDTFIACSGNKQGIIVTDKTAKITSKNKYENFDTDETISYIPSNNYQLQENTVDIKNIIKLYNGTMPEKISDITAVEPGATVEHTFDATLLTTSADREEMTNDQFTDDYFSVIGNVVKRSGGNGVKSLEIAKNSGGAIIFTVTGTAEITLGACSTSSLNTSAIEIVNEKNETMVNKEGADTVTGSTTTELHYILPAGTYTVVSPRNTNYVRAVHVIFIDVSEKMPGNAEEVKNGLIYNEADGLWYYYEKNEWVSNKYDFVEYNGGYFFVANGIMQVNSSGLQLFGDNFYFLSNGQLQNYTGLALYDGEFFYVENGVLAINYYGLLDYDDSKFLIAAGRIVGDYTGLYNDSVTGKWYYIVYGQVQTDYTGLVLYDGAWFYLVNGVLASDYTGTVIYDGAEFTVVNGQVVA